MKKHSNFIGWVGTAFIVSAYFFVSFSILSPNTAVYQVLNLLGALGIVFSSYIKKDNPPVVLNIFWALIALLGLIKSTGIL